MKKCFFLLIVLSSLHNVFSQSKGYLIKGDTALVQGWIEYSKSRPNVVKLNFSKIKWEEYNADQVSEFGFNNSTKYVSKIVSVEDIDKNTFLRQLEEGPTRLYILEQRGKDRLFIEEDTLVEISSFNLNRILKKYANSSTKWLKQLSLVKPNKNSLSFFIRNHNANKFVNIPFYRFGINTDFAIFKMTLVSNTNNDELDDIIFRTSTLKFGIFAESPIWNVNGLSLVKNVNYFKGELVETSTNENIYDIRGNYSFIEFNLSPKYTFNYDKVRPFVIAGGQFKYLLNSNVETYQTMITGNTISIELLENNPLDFDSIYYGIQYGVGVNIFYDIKRSISLSILGSNSFGNTTGKINSLSISLAGNI